MPTSYSLTTAARWGAAVSVGLALVACTDAEPETRPSVNPPPVGLDATDEPTDDATSGPDPTLATTAPTTELPTIEATDPGSLPEWLSGTTVAQSEPSGDMLLPVALRVGDHDDFDRVVVELDGDGVPGWRVEYVTEAIADGSGERLGVEGDAILQVVVTGTRYPDEGEDHYTGPMRLDGDDAVEEVRYVGTFEGLTQLFVGVDEGRENFRVFALAQPPRLVVDIRED